VAAGRVSGSTAPTGRERGEIYRNADFSPDERPSCSGGEKWGWRAASAGVDQGLFLCDGRHGSVAETFGGATAVCCSMALRCASGRQQASALGGEGVPAERRTVACCSTWPTPRCRDWCLPRRLVLTQRSSAEGAISEELPRTLRLPLLTRLKWSVGQTQKNGNHHIIGDGVRPTGWRSGPAANRGQSRTASSAAGADRQADTRSTTVRMCSSRGYVVGVGEPKHQRRWRQRAEQT